MAAPALRKQGVDGRVKHGHDGVGEWVIGHDGWHSLLQSDNSLPTDSRDPSLAVRGIARENSNLMTTLKVGIASYEDMKAGTMAVARGEQRNAASEPKIWFTSTESFAKFRSCGPIDFIGVVAPAMLGKRDRQTQLNGEPMQAPVTRQQLRA